MHYRFLGLLYEVLLSSSYIEFAGVLFTQFFSMQDALSAFDDDASLEVVDHPVLNVIYYMVAYQVFFKFQANFLVLSFL